MARGPGKYSDIAMFVRRMTLARGAIVLIFEGDHGTGYSSQLPPTLVGKIPQYLRDLADEIQADNQAPHYPPIPPEADHEPAPF